jgi:hypothetical protein
MRSARVQELMVVVVVVVVVVMIDFSLFVLCGFFELEFLFLEFSSARADSGEGFVQW